MYIAKKRIKQAIDENGGKATFEQIADYTEYDCMDLAHRIRLMVNNGELCRDDNRCYSRGLKIYEQSRKKSSQTN